MATTRPQGSGDGSRPQEAPTTGTKRLGTGGQPASKRRRSDEDRGNKTIPDNQPVKEKKSRERRTKTSSKPETSTSTSRGHIRFGSEDPTVPALDIAPSTTHGGTDEDDRYEAESDDDAPEDVTAADAQATTTAAQKQATRAVEQQQANSRKKRQVREARLQEQAKTSNKPRRSRVVDLPDLLPEDVLAGEAFARPPTPPPEEVARSKPTGGALNKNSIKFEDNRPKDIQVGPVRVSVLQKQSMLLPPMANGRTKSVKEQWLAGRRGSGVSRKRAGSGFVRS